MPTQPTSKTTLPLVNRRPSLPADTPQQIKDAINRLYDIVYLHASSIEQLRQTVNTKT